MLGPFPRDTPLMVFTREGRYRRTLCRCIHPPPPALMTQAPEPHSPARPAPPPPTSAHARGAARQPVPRGHPLQCHSHTSTLMAETFLTSWCTDSRSLRRVFGPLTCLSCSPPTSRETAGRDQDGGGGVRGPAEGAPQGVSSTDVARTS